MDRRAVQATWGPRGIRVADTDTAAQALPGVAVTEYGEMYTCIDRATKLFTGEDPRAQAREHLWRTLSADAYMRRDRSSLIHLTTEEAFDEDQRPSYQIAGPLCEALQQTRLDLDPDRVRFPHRSFALELPLRGPGVIRDHDLHRRLLAILIGGVVCRGGAGVVCEIPEAQAEWRILIVQRWEGEDDIDPPWFLTTFESGGTVDDAVEGAISVGFRESVWSKEDGGVRPQPETMQRVVRLAIGAALFAVGANAKFCDRVREPRQRRRRRERCERQGAPVGAGDELVHRWRLGATIALPGAQEGVGATEEAGGGLRFSHLRQGHLRMQRMGPSGDHRYVLRYIAPTVVRPDLGFPEGYQATRHRLERPEDM